MKTRVTVSSGLAVVSMLLSLALLVSCKQGDTRGSAQTIKAADTTEAPASPRTVDQPEKKEAMPAPAAPKRTALARSAPAKTEKQQSTKVAGDVNMLPPAAAGAPAGQRAANPVEQLLQKPKPALPTFGPDDPRSGIYLSITGKIAGMGDPSQAASDAYKYGKGSHPKALAGVGLPKDKFGLIDWMAIVNEGIIKPRGSLKPGVPDLPPFDMNVRIVSKGDFVNDVMFPHKAHTYWLKCENCHTGIFIMAKGKNKMTMQGIVEGKWCGRCHGKVAFPLTDCNRCHQTPKEG